jgi:hypothetical protein
MRGISEIILSLRVVFRSRFRIMSASLHVQYSLDVICDEVRHLLNKGLVARQQPIYILCQHIPAREWLAFERELEHHDFFLRDRIGDLLGHEVWSDD